MKNVLVIGGGSIGQAIGASFGPDVAVKIFDNNPSKATVATIEEGISTANIIFICVPSQGAKLVIDKIAQSGAEASVILLTKGLDEETGQFPYELLQSAGIKKFGILYGPMIAQKILEKKHSFGLFASTDETIAQELKELFLDFIHIEYTQDIHTVAILGILKNIYSLGAGMLQGLNVGENVLGMYTVRVLQEMKIIIGGLGGDISKAENTAGLGDFIATSTSEYSKNRETGNDLISGQLPPSTSEGLASLQLFCKKLTTCPPLLNTLNGIAQKTITPDKLLDAVISYE